MLDECSASTGNDMLLSCSWLFLTGIGSCLAASSTTGNCCSGTSAGSCGLCLMGSSAAAGGGLTTTAENDSASGLLRQAPILVACGAPVRD